MSAPDDADDLRGFHFKGLMRKSLTWVLIAAEVLVAGVAGAAFFGPAMFCQRKFGLRSLEKFEDVFRGSKQRVKLESEALDDKYEIFAGKGQDAGWLRQLFSPTFIVWLTDSAPKKFAFELVDGTLCCYVSDHKKSAEDLDMVRTASAAVATRLREEALEELEAAKESSGIGYEPSRDHQ